MVIGFEPSDFFYLGGENVDVDFFHAGDEGIMTARVAECVQQKIAVLEEKIHHIIYRIAPLVAVPYRFFS